MKEFEQKAMSMALPTNFEHVCTRGTVQRIPTALRLKFFACAFVIYDYLRSNGQLGRTERRFDAEVMQNLGKTLQTLGTELYDKHGRDSE